MGERKTTQELRRGMKFSGLGTGWIWGWEWGVLREDPPRLRFGLTVVRGSGRWFPARSTA